MKPSLGRDKRVIRDFIRKRFNTASPRKLDFGLGNSLLQYQFGKIGDGNIQHCRLHSKRAVLSHSKTSCFIGFVAVKTGLELIEIYDFTMYLVVRFQINLKYEF